MQTGWSLETGTAGSWVRGCGLGVGHPVASQPLDALLAVCVARIVSVSLTVSAVFSSSISWFAERVDDVTFIKRALKAITTTASRALIIHFF
jgi:hypothetical protein